MADERVNFILSARDQATATVKRLKGELGAMGGTASAATGPLGKLSAVTGGLISPTTLLFGAATAAGAALLGTSRAAMEEQKGISALTAALRANDPAAAANIAQIEATIREREKLAFADDTQRESLAGLIAVTKDSGKALDLQRTAMDLARLKNMDLKAASDLVGKVYAGNLGMLSRYGIVLARGTTATEALAEIQRRAAGQAEEYGTTTAGAMESAGMAFEDAVEDVGALLLPVLRDLAIFVRDDLIPALYDIGEVVGNVIGWFDSMGAALEGFTQSAHSEMDQFAMNFGDQATTVKAEAANLGLSFDELKDQVAGRMIETGESFEAAMAGIKADAEGARLKTLGEAWEMMQGITSAIYEEAPNIQDASDNVAAMPAGAIVAQQQAVRDAAYQSQVEYAKGLMDGQNLPKVAFDAAMQMLDEEMTEEQEVARLQGQLVTLEHAAGIAAQEGKTASLNAINAAIAVITDRLSTLPSAANTYGFNTAYAFATGLNRGYGYVVTAAGTLAAATRGQIGVESEPRDPSSPLRGITRWGGNLVRTYVGGMLQELGAARRVAGTVASALAPGLLGFGGGAAVGAYGGGFLGGGAPAVTINIETFYGTDENIETLSRSLARHLRLQGAPVALVPS